MLLINYLIFILINHCNDKEYKNYHDRYFKFLYISINFFTFSQVNYFERLKCCNEMSSAYRRLLIEMPFIFPLFMIFKCQLEYLFHVRCQVGMMKVSILGELL